MLWRDLLVAHRPILPVLGRNPAPPQLSTLTPVLSTLSLPCCLIVSYLLKGLLLKVALPFPALQASRNPTHQCRSPLQKRGQNSGRQSWISEAGPRERRPEMLPLRWSPHTLHIELFRRGNCLSENHSKLGYPATAHFLIVHVL